MCNNPRAQENTPGEAVTNQGDTVARGRVALSLSLSADTALHSADYQLATLIVPAIETGIGTKILPGNVIGLKFLSRPAR